MCAFHYRFERILNLKQKIEKEKKIELALVQKRLDEQFMAKEKLALTKKGVLKKLAEAKEGAINLTYVKELRGNISVISDRARAIDANIEQLNELKAKRIEALTEAVKERKKYEQIKEYKYEQYRKAESMKEQNFLDEIGTNSFVRQHEIDSAASAGGTK